MELSLLIRGRKLFGSLLNVISSSDRNRFIPANRLCGLRGHSVSIAASVRLTAAAILTRLSGSYVLAEVFLEGIPSNTMTLSAR